MSATRVVASLLALHMLACNAPDAPRFAAWGVLVPNRSDHETVIVGSLGLGALDVSEDAKSAGRARIPCATCHEDGGSPALASRDGHPLGFHFDIILAHGPLKCSSCHDKAHPNTLRLSSGDALPLTDYMQLCAQCHGPQYRDYEHGSHGGMKGYWDLQRGPRERNSCLACHGAHSPAYPLVLPAPPPNDRFLEPRHQPGSTIEDRWSGASP